MKHKPLTLGILGAANIAREFAEDVQATNTVVVTAVASRTAQKARAFANSFGIATAYASYDALLQDANIEAVYLPLPNSMHAEWAIKAAQHGKHVLCEKPLGVGLAQVQSMFAAAKANKVMLLEAYPYWFQPQTREMLRLLSSGAIGRVRDVHAAFSFMLGQSPGNIRLNPELGGGALLDLGCYNLSFIRLVMGEAPVRVRAQPVWTADGVDISMQASLEFADGRTASIACAMDSAYNRHATITGTAGVMQTNYVNHTERELPSQLLVRRTAAKTSNFENVRFATGSGFKFTVEAFADVVRRGDFAAIERVEQASLDIARTLEAIALSARSGKSVTL